MTEETSVLVIGAASTDIKGQPDEQLFEGSSAPGMVRSGPGGTARNIAENLARLEVNTTLLTAVGDDYSGEQILGQAAASGINVSEALIVPGQRSGAYMAVLKPGGALAYAFYDTEIMAALTPEYFEAREHLFEAARMIVLDANLPEDSLKYIVSLCGQLGTPICADPTSVSLAHKLRPHLSALLMVTPNAAEAQVLCGAHFQPNDQSEAQQAARSLLTTGVEIAIITLSESGVVYANAETQGHIPAVPTHIIDQTGAGDAQAAGIIFGLLEDIPIDECVRLGVTAASLTLRTRHSVRPDLSIDLLYDDLAS